MHLETNDKKQLTVVCFQCSWKAKNKLFTIAKQKQLSQR